MAIMSKRQIIMVLGALVALLLFLGFPSAWQKAFEVIAGFLIIIIAYRMSPNVNDKRSRDSVPYVEHRSSAPIAEAKAPTMPEMPLSAETITNNNPQSK